MAESFSTERSESPVNAKSRTSESLNPCKSSPTDKDLSCMNRPPGSELSRRYNSSFWLPEASSSDKSESYGGIDLNLDLDLTLWVNHVDRNHTDPEPSLPIAVGMEQARIAAAKDFQFPTLNRQDNNNDMYSDSGCAVNAVAGFKRNYPELIVGQHKRVQGSASVTSKENPQEIHVVNWNEAKHLAFSSNKSRQSRSSATNHSGIATVDGLSNLSQDKVRHLSTVDPDLRDNFTDADGPSTSTIEDRGIGWPPIRANRRSSLCSFHNPSGENQQGAMAGSFVQGQGNSLYVKVQMDGMPICRKLDLNAYESYETLAQDLENMFGQTTENDIGACLTMTKKHAVNPLSLLDPASDFVLAYEDNEGDCMLVGDVPWKMFLQTVKRLRIKNCSGSNAFAQKCSKKRKAT